MSADEFVDHDADFVNLPCAAPKTEFVSVERGDDGTVAVECGTNTRGGTMSEMSIHVDALKSAINDRYWEQLPCGWEDDLFAKFELVQCVRDIISDVALAVAVAVTDEFKSVEDRRKVMDAAARARDKFKGNEGEW